MKHSATMDLRGTLHTVSVEVDYDAPKKGFEIHPGIFLSENMKIGINWSFDQEKKEYIANPMVSRLDGSPVFYADGFSWRITD